jgi:uncharacterized protein YukE/carbon monoxide dehydrogenase subunit G
MGIRLGANPDELRGLARTVGQHAARLETSAADLAALVARLPWRGNDAEQFRAAWARRHQPELARLAASLRDGARTLVANAGRQEETSAAGSPSALGALADSLVPGPLREAYSRLDGWYRESAALAAHRQELEDSLVRVRGASPLQQMAWWAELPEADRAYLLTATGDDGRPLAEQLLRMDGLPRAALDAAQQELIDRSKAGIAVYSEKSSLELEAKVAWVHGGAELGSEIVAHADGSASLKVYGELAGGANTPGAGAEAGVTLSGELSRTYSFGSLAEAQEAQDRMIRELPPDSAGDVGDLAAGRQAYLLGVLDDAAYREGADGHSDALKGTFEAYAKADAESSGAEASAEASLSMSYERSLEDGTATAEAKALAKADLDLGDVGFSGDGEVGIRLALDGSGQITSMTLALAGRTMENANAGEEFSPAPGRKESLDSTIAVGQRSSLSVEMPYTPENAALIDGLLADVARDDAAGIARGTGALYTAGYAVIQTDAERSAEVSYSVDGRVVEVSATVASETSTNIATYIKLPYQDGYTAVVPDRKDR